MTVTIKPHVPPTNNITNLNDLIYAEVNVVSDKLDILMNNIKSNKKTKDVW